MPLAVDFILQIAQGLSALHHAGILHRDIKPSNILFADANTLVIADLGIAKDLSGNQELALHGQVMGTPYYMSPEQIDGAAIDPRADIYSLGILFYELLTGVRPFPGTSIMEVAYKHAYDPAPPSLHRWRYGSRYWTACWPRPPGTAIPIWKASFRLCRRGDQDKI